MSKEVMSFRATSKTQEQIKQLTAWGFGNTTVVIQIAIDRMHREETKNMYSKTQMINISERYGGPEPVEIEDYQELNSEGEFDEYIGPGGGLTIREHTNGDWETIAVSEHEYHADD